MGGELFSPLIIEDIIDEGIWYSFAQLEQRLGYSMSFYCKHLRNQSKIYGNTYYIKGEIVIWYHHNIRPIIK